MYFNYLSGVKFGGEATGITNSLRAATFMDDGGEADNDRSLNSGSAEEVGTGEVSNIMGAFKEAFGTGSSCMNYTFSRSGMSSLGKISYFSIM